jgi:hypothetical protein
VHVDPQTGQPGTKFAGDIYVNSTSGKPELYDGNEWAKFGLNVYTSVADSDVTASGTNDYPAPAQYTIPSGVLTAGSVIRIRVSGAAVSVGGGGDFGVLLYIGGTLLTASAQIGIATSPEFYMEADVVVRASPSASTAVRANGRATIGNGPAADVAIDRTTANLATNGTLLIKAQAFHQNAGNTSRVDFFEVDIHN